MAYTYTKDEKTLGGLIFNSVAGQYDAPSSVFLTDYTLAESITSYGATIRPDWFTADIDTYHLGTLAPGQYSLDVDGYNWDFSNLIFGYDIVEFGFADNIGNILSFSSSTATDVSLSLSQSTDIYAYVMGSQYADAEYSITYKSTYQNTLATIDFNITGTLNPGEKLSAVAFAYDPDGTVSSIPAYVWFVDGSPEFYGQEFTLDNSHIGKLIEVGVGFFDDMLNFEEAIESLGTVNSVSVQTQDPNQERSEYTFSEFNTYLNLQGFDANVIKYLIKDPIVKWGSDLGTAPNLTFSITPAGPISLGTEYRNDGSVSQDLTTYSAVNSNLNAQQFTVAEKSEIIEAINDWSIITGINFTEVIANVDDPADITFTKLDLQAWSDSGLASSYLLNNPVAGFVSSMPDLENDFESGDVYVNSDLALPFKHVISHEIGHALGLAHPHHGYAEFGDGDFPFSDDMPNYLSIMSYDETEFLLPSSPMEYDLITMQAIYGGREANTGDDTYNFSVDEFRLINPSGYRTRELLHDASGFDEVIFSAPNLTSEDTGVFYNLKGGTFSSLFSHDVIIESSDELKYSNGDLYSSNVTQIEKVTATPGRDVITADVSWETIVLAGAGDDVVLTSGNGSTLNGGLGINDTLMVTATDTSEFDLIEIGFSSQNSGKLYDAAGDLHCSIIDFEFVSLIDLALQEASTYTWDEFVRTYAPPSNSAPTGYPTISGTPKEGETLTVSTDVVNDANGLGTFSYQWVRAGFDISGATSSSYTLTSSDVGENISVRVSFTDGGGTLETVSSTATPDVAAANNPPTGYPTISGTPKEGETLTVSTDVVNDANGLGTFSYQWVRAGFDISGATSSSYTLTSSDVGENISVRVSFTDGGGTLETVSSTATPDVAAANNPPTGYPTISGTPKEGETLTVSTDVVNDANGLGTFSYQWVRAGFDISGATSSSYTLTSSDVGENISVRVSFTDGGGTLETVSSTATPDVAAANNPPTGYPTISGTPKEGETLTVSTDVVNDANGLGTFSYQWVRAGFDISGATSSSYTLTSSDVGENISVRVSFTDGGGTLETVSSTATPDVAAANNPPTGYPTISGTPKEGETLTVSTDVVNDANGLGTFSYQWVRAGFDISGATSSSYTLTSSDVGENISVRVSFTDGGGTLETVTSGNYKFIQPLLDATLTVGSQSTGTFGNLWNNLTDDDGIVTASFIPNNPDTALVLSLDAYHAIGTQKIKVEVNDQSIGYLENGLRNNIKTFEFDISNSLLNANENIIKFSTSSSKFNKWGIENILIDEASTMDATLTVGSQSTGTFGNLWNNLTDDDGIVTASFIPNNPDTALVLSLDAYHAIGTQKIKVEVNDQSIGYLENGLRNNIKTFEFDISNSLLNANENIIKFSTSSSKFNKWGIENILIDEASTMDATLTVGSQSTGTFGNLWNNLTDDDGIVTASFIPNNPDTALVLSLDAYHAIGTQKIKVEVNDQSIGYLENGLRNNIKTFEFDISNSLLNANENIIKFSTSSSKFNKWGIENILIDEASTMDATLTVGSQSTGTFGNLWNNLTDDDGIVTASFIPNNPDTALVLSLDAYHAIGTQKIKVEVNDQSIGYLENGLRNNIKTFEFDISNSLLNANENIIKFSTSSSKFNKWGIENILIDEASTMDATLTVGSQSTGTFGNLWNNLTDDDGIVTASFIPNNPDTALVLSLDAYHAIGTQKIKVEVNDQSIGYLENGLRNNIKTFEFDISNSLLNANENIIKFSTSSSKFNKWGIENILIDEASTMDATLTVGSQSTGTFGNLWNNLTDDDGIVTASFIPNNPDTALVLSLDAYHAIGTQKIKVEVNDQSIGYLENGLRNNIKTFEFDISNSLLNANENIIKFSTSSSKFNKWGIENILIDEASTMDATLTVGSQSTGTFGNLWNNLTDDDGIVTASFIPNNPDTALVLSLDAYHAIGTQKIKVEVNDQSIGYLENGLRNNIKTFEFDISNSLLNANENIIKFSTSSSKFNKWGIENILIDEASDFLISIDPI